jgi:hypothetical protein
MTTYTADVGQAEARWLADPAHGPLSTAGFYGQGIGGLITDLRDGRVMLDENAVAALRGLPPDWDGHVSDQDGLVLSVGGAQHRLIPEAAPDPPST